MRIPVAEIGQAVRDQIWNECATPLGLNSCQFTVFEPGDLNDQIEDYFPAVLILEPTWEGQKPAGRSPMGWPLQIGTLTLMIVFARQFSVSDTSPDWTASLLEDVEILQSAVTKKTNGHFAGNSETVTVSRLWISRVGLLAQPEAENQVVRLAEAQIWISLDLEIEEEE